jgi:hypothetical protein
MEHTQLVNNPTIVSLKVQHPILGEFKFVYHKLTKTFESWSVTNSSKAGTTRTTQSILFTQDISNHDCFYSHITQMILNGDGMHDFHWEMWIESVAEQLMYEKLTKAFV